MYLSSGTATVIVIHTKCRTCSLFFHSEFFAICRLRHVHVRKDTRFSLLFHTASHEKLGEVWENFLSVSFCYSSNPCPSHMHAHTHANMACTHMNTCTHAHTHTHHTHHTHMHAYTYRPVPSISRQRCTSPLPPCQCPAPLWHHVVPQTLL